MTDDVQAFLRAIIAAPDDDAPRLIYADWLDEHGNEERASLIRLGMELAKFPEDFDINDKTTDWMRRSQLKDAVRHLADNSGGIGLIYAELRDALGQEPQINFNGWGNAGIVYDVSRGFLDFISCTAADWLRFGDVICERHPVCRMRMTTMPVLNWRPDRREKLTRYWLPTRKEVVFISELRHRTKAIGGSANERVLVKRLLEKAWPRIKFDLPLPDHA